MTMFDLDQYCLPIKDKIENKKKKCCVPAIIDRVTEKKQKDKRDYYSKDERYLFHLSSNPCLTVMSPRTILSKVVSEPNDKRICFSKSVIGCFFAVSPRDIENKDRVYLYRTKYKTKYIYPYNVKDSRVTEEVWIKEDIAVELLFEFNKYWLHAIPCITRGSMHNEQKQDIRAIRRMFYGGKISGMKTGIDINWTLYEYWQIMNIVNREPRKD